MKKRSILILVGALSLVSMNAQAIQGVLVANVLSTLVAANNSFGGCMALLSKNINTATNAPNCPLAWVTFSCSGPFTTQDIAYRMLDQAQLAKATNRPVVVVVDDSKKINGICFATRIDVN